jgi:hypothetical protein
MRAAEDSVASRKKLEHGFLSATPYIGRGHTMDSVFARDLRFRDTRSQSHEIAARISPALAHAVDRRRLESAQPFRLVGSHIFESVFPTTAIRRQANPPVPLSSSRPGLPCCFCASRWLSTLGSLPALLQRGTSRSERCGGGRRCGDSVVDFDARRRFLGEFLVGGTAASGRDEGDVPDARNVGCARR